MAHQLSPSERLDLEKDIAVAKQKGFCPFCLHDLFREDYCDECNTPVPATPEQYMHDVKKFVLEG